MLRSLPARFQKNTLQHNAGHRGAHIQRGRWGLGNVFYPLRWSCSWLSTDTDRPHCWLKLFQQTHRLHWIDLIGDYYVLHNKKAAFWYIFTSDVQAFALSKSFLFGKIFNKFPEILTVSKNVLRTYTWNQCRALVSTDKITNNPTTNRFLTTN